MKCTAMMLLSLVALAAAQAGVESTESTSPVSRVTKLLADLRDKVGADGKSEEHMYNKYACWCETTTTKKANDITKAETELRSLGQQILKLKGKVATLTAEIKDLSEKIGENDEEQGEATALRQKRNGKFMAMQAETKEGLAALEKAINVLTKGTKLLQTDSAAQATSAVQSVLDKIPSEATLDGDHMSALTEFIQNGADATYAPQSATIQGILGDMYDTFAANLEDATMAEAKQNKNYEKLSATLEQENIDLNTVKSRKDEEKANAESDLADTTATYDDTTDQMKSDIKFFDQTKNACDTKHSEWVVRQKLRAEELKGIETALGFLSSDAARDLFAKSIKPGVEAASFLQIATDDSQAVSLKAYNMLKAQATKSKSFRLAALAVRVRTAKVGHFDKVIKAIDLMMATLDEEGQADIAKRNQCKDQYQKVALAMQDVDWKIKNNVAKIDKLDSLIEMRTKERQETIDQINDTNDYIKKITADRKEEREEYLKARADDETAIALLNKAKKALTAFDKKNGIKSGPIQGLRLMQGEPKFEFSDKGNSKGQKKGITSLMTSIIEDLEDEVTNGRKAEAKNTEDFLDEKKTAEALRKDLLTKKSNLANIIAKRNSEKTEEKKDMNSNNKNRDSELAYKAKITPDCDWIQKNFHGRAQARDTEMNGLVSAKEFLAGKTAFLQGKAIEQESPVVENKLASIAFLGIH
jgi:hypothetical protein